MPGFQTCCSHSTHNSSYDRPLCRDTNTLSTVLLVGFVTILSVSAVCQGIIHHDQQQENKDSCVRVGSARAEKTSCKSLKLLKDF